MTQTDLAIHSYGIAAGIDARIAADPEGLFAVLPDGPMTRAGLDARARSTGRQLAELGARPGCRLALFTTVESVALPALLAALRAGMATIMGDADATPRGLRDVIEMTRPDFVIADRRLTDVPEIAANHPGLCLLRVDGDTLQPLTPAPCSIRPDGDPDTALIIPTSGSTGQARAVMLGHRALAAQFDVFADAYGFNQQTRLSNVLRLHHVDGLIRGPLSAMWFGACVWRPFSFSIHAAPAILAALSSEALTHLITVPAMLRILMRTATESRLSSSLRFILCSADTLDPETWRAAEARFGVPVVNAYGLTEAVCDVVIAGPDAASRRPGTIGRAYGCTVRILAGDGTEASAGMAGELTLAGPLLMQGYFDAPQATSAVLRDGWLHTGDLVRRRDDGLLEHAGRRKAVIIAAGVTIHPESITATLRAMPGLRDVHAFSLPDRAGEDRLALAVVPTPRDIPITARDVRGFCRAQLPADSQPARVLIVDDIPRGASGKVSAEALAALVAASPEEATEGQASGTPRERVISIAASLFGMPAESLGPDSSPFTIPDWDSLAHMELIAAVEKAFAFTFTPEDVTMIATLGDLIDITERHA